jgi:heme/copper-type cytochrome/quinol oxidase subunit 4
MKPAHKKILLTALYPFWFFFAKTWVGNLLTIPMVLLPVPTAVHLVFPDLMMQSSGQSIEVGFVLFILTLFCSSFIGGFLMIAAHDLENYYANKK